MYKVLGRTFQNPTHALMALFSWTQRDTDAVWSGKIELETGEAIAYYTINKIDLYDPYWTNDQICEVQTVFGVNLPEYGYRPLRRLQIWHKQLVSENKYNSIRLL